MTLNEILAGAGLSQCTCDEGYSNRNLKDPQCNYHNYYEFLHKALEEWGEKIYEKAYSMETVEHLSGKTHYSIEQSWAENKHKFIGEKK